MAEKRQEGPRSFARFLESVCDGEVHTEASAKFHELVQELEKEAEARGKATGKIVVTLNVSLDSRGQAEIGFDVVTKEPKKERGKGVAWLTPGSNFVFSNPRQQKLPLRDVSTESRLADDQEDGRRAVADL